MAKMETNEFQEYLREPNIAHLVTIDAKKYPLVTPIWYIWSNNEFYIFSRRDSEKIRNIISNSNVAISVANNEKPYKYISIKGDAEILDPFDPEWIRNIAIHYDGPEKGMEFAEECLKNDMVILKIDVHSIRSAIYFRE